MNWTDEQERIFEAGRQHPGSLLLTARAGTAKTTTLLELIRVIPQASVLVLAFNKRIAEEMKQRVALLHMPRTRAVHVKTFHGAGLWVLSRHFPQLMTASEATEELIDTSPVERGTKNFRVKNAAIKLVRFMKETSADPDPDVDEQREIGIEQGFFDQLSNAEIDQATFMAGRTYRRGMDFYLRTKIDFCDMVWGVMINNLAPPSRYQAVLVDELQDLSELQLRFIDCLLAPMGRVIAAGDDWQKIYSWRGAAAHSFEYITERYQAQRMPLTTTFRCSQAVVAEANRLVPDLRAAPSAEVGSVTRESYERFFEILVDIPPNQSTFVLSRDNASLLRVALDLWKRQVGFRLALGNDVLSPLKAILKRLDTGKEGFLPSLLTWRLEELKRAEAADSAAWAERIEEQHEMLYFAWEHVDEPSEIVDLLETIFHQDAGYHITLSTVHKAKGLEAVHVFLLTQTFAAHRPLPFPGAERTITDEDLRIEYVAITRAKRTLTWVSLPPKEG